MSWSPGRPGRGRCIARERVRKSKTEPNVFDRFCYKPPFSCGPQKLLLTQQETSMKHCIKKPKLNSFNCVFWPCTISRQRRKYEAQAKMFARKNIACVLLMWWYFYLEHSVSCYTLPICGILIEKAACRGFMWLIMMAGDCYSNCHSGVERIKWFVSVGVPTCYVIIRNLIYPSMGRFTVSENSVIQASTFPLALSCFHSDCGDIGTPLCTEL